jgi:branched-chain amino acid transport system permease protein
MKRLLLLALLLAAVPFAMKNQGVLYFMTLIMVLGVFAVGYDIVFGMAGLLSFGHAAFFGIGSYVFAFLVLKSPAWGLPAIGIAGVAGAIVAVAVAAIALRLAGIYFSLMTLAIAELLFYAASSPLRGLTGGEEGLVGVPRPAFAGIDFYNEGYFYLLVLCFFVAGLAASRVLRASPLGQAMRGVKVNEIRADQLGFNVRRIKLAAFGISGFYSGVAGALLGALMQFVNPQGLHWSTSGDIVIMTLLGGAGTLFGPVIGVVAFEVLKEILSARTVHFYGIVGIIFILTTLFLPTGIHGAFESVAARWKARRAARPATPSTRSLEAGAAK